MDGSTGNLSLGNTNELYTSFVPFSISHHLSVDEICSLENLENSIQNWIKSFSENSQKAIEFGLKIYHEHFQDNFKHEKLENLFREMIDQDHLSDDFQN